MVAMTGQVELRVVAPQFQDGDALTAAMDRAATLIYADFQRGGPAIAGNTDARAMTCLLWIEEDTPEAWMPQLQVLVRAVEGPIESVGVASFSEGE